MDLSSEELYEIRRKNTRLLARRMGGQKALAQAMRRDPSLVSSIIGKRHRENIGQKLATVIEKAAGVHEGWLDSTDNNAAASAAYADIDFLAMLLDQILEATGTELNAISTKKMAGIIYNAHIVKTRFSGLPLDEMKPHIDSLLNLAIDR